MAGSTASKTGISLTLLPECTSARCSPVSCLAGCPERPAKVYVKSCREGKCTEGDRYPSEGNADGEVSVLGAILSRPFHRARWRPFFCFFLGGGEITVGLLCEAALFCEAALAEILRVIVVTLARGTRTERRVSSEPSVAMFSPTAMFSFPRSFREISEGVGVTRFE